jgi:hypothetical protein
VPENALSANKYDQSKKIPSFSKEGIGFNRKKQLA